MNLTETPQGSFLLIEESYIKAMPKNTLDPEKNQFPLPISNRPYFIRNINPRMLIFIS